MLLATAEGVERSTNRPAIARSAILRKVEQLKKIGSTLEVLKNQYWGDAVERRSKKKLEDTSLS